MIRSPFFYVGDKYKLAEQLRNIFPNNIQNLVEPFCGGGSVFLNIQAEGYISNDNNPWMIKLHKFLTKYANHKRKFFKEFHGKIEQYGFSASYLGKNVPANLKKKYIKTHYAVFNKEAYSKAKKDFNKNQEDLMLLYVLLVYGFNHMLRFNSNGEFNLPVGNVDYNKNVYDALNNYFDFAQNHKVKFSCMDFVKFLAKVDLTNNDFVYLDPPYLITSSEYNKFWTEKEERKLLEQIDLLNSKGIKFALSNVIKHKGKTNVLLEEWSSKYNIHQIKSNYICYYDNSIKEDTIEVLITNY